MLLKLYEEESKTLNGHLLKKNPREYKKKKNTLWPSEVYFRNAKIIHY